MRGMSMAAAPAIRLALAVALGLAVTWVPARAADLVIVATDTAGEGFFDSKPVAPVGGNDATTLGGQRLNAFQHAADLIGVHLRDGGVDVVVEASFDRLGGSAERATLAFAQPLTVHAGFVGAPRASTWYVAALANSLAGADLAGAGTSEILAQFNSDVDGELVLGDTDFYYGLDGNDGSDIEFVTVALHELVHGLGFIHIFSDDGSKFSGLDDAYLLNLRDDNFVPGRLSEMTDEQRWSALRDGPDLLWDGAGVRAADPDLQAGLRGDGSIEIYAPDPLRAGSSVAHFSDVLFPHDLMEPFATGVRRELLLTLALLGDLNWPLIPCGDADASGEVLASDALGALQTSVGGGDCAPAICDADSNGDILTSDALRILQFAVGLPVDMDCPFPI